MVRTKKLQARDLCFRPEKKLDKCILIGNNAHNIFQIQSCILQLKHLIPSISISYISAKKRTRIDGDLKPPINFLLWKLRCFNTDVFKYCGITLFLLLNYRRLLA